MKTLILKKKHIAIFMAVILVFSFLFLCVKLHSNLKTSSPKTKYTVVIDAGHGGIDGGSVGINTNITEANLNLDYAKCLQNMMTEFGFKVVMTRTTDNGLYNPLASNKKKDDMKKRKEIIENSNADFVISIHMNSYNSTSKGAQVFYGKNDEPSKFLADKIQKYFINYLVDARKETKVGDYYILNAIPCPSVLVEVGYLSNPKEETLLVTEEYKKEVAYSILLGVLEYLR